MSNDRFSRYCEITQISPIRDRYTVNQVAILLTKSPWTVQDWAYGKSTSPIKWTYEPPVTPGVDEDGKPIGKGHWFVERDVLARYINSFQTSIPNLRIPRINHKRNLPIFSFKSKAIA